MRLAFLLALIGVGLSFVAGQTTNTTEPDQGEFNTGTCRVTSVSASLIGGAVVNLASFVSISPSFSPDVTAYTYSLAAASSQLTGSLSFNVNLGVEASDVTVEVTANGQAFTSFSGATSGGVLTRAITVSASQNLCLNLVATVSGGSCTTRTYTITCSSAGAGETGSNGGGETGDDGNAGGATGGNNGGETTPPDQGGFEDSTGTDNGNGNGNTGTDSGNGNTGTDSGNGNNNGTTGTDNGSGNGAGSTAPAQGGFEDCPTAYSFSGVTLTPAWSPSVTTYTCSYTGTSTVITVGAQASNDTSNQGGGDDSSNGGGAVTATAGQNVRRRLFFVTMATNQVVSGEMTTTNTPSAGALTSGGFTFNGQTYSFTNGASSSLTWATTGSNVFVISGGDECPTYTITCDAPTTGTPDNTSTAPDQGENNEGSTGAQQPPEQGGSEDNTACRLSSLSLGSALVFYPEFSATRYTYTCSCGTSTFLSTVTAVAGEGTTLSLNSNGVISSLLSGVESASYQLAVGANSLKVSVTGSDSCQAQYELNCWRPAPATGEQNQTTPTYNWHTGTYSNCSGVCGTDGTNSTEGEFTRAIECWSESGTVVEDSLCTGEKPVATNTCTPICLTTGRDVIIGDGDDANNDGDDDDLCVGDCNSAAATSVSFVALLTTAFGAAVATRFA